MIDMAHQINMKNLEMRLIKGGWMSFRYLYGFEKTHTIFDCISIANARQTGSRDRT